MERKLVYFCLFASLGKKPNSQLKTTFKYCTPNALFLLFPWLKHPSVCKKPCPCLIVGSLSLIDGQAGKAFKGRLWLPCAAGIARPTANQTRTGETTVHRCEKEQWWAQRARVKGWGWARGRVPGPARTAQSSGSCSSQGSRRGLLSLLLLPSHLWLL